MASNIALKKPPFEYKEIDTESLRRTKISIELDDGNYRKVEIPTFNGLTRLT